METTFTAENAHQWHEWLEKNHSEAQEVWLVFWKKHTGKTGIDYDESVAEAICYGWIDGLIKPLDEDRYARRFSPRKAKSPWSPINRERALEMIREGRMTDAGMDSVRGARENGTWYSVPVQVEMPDELEDELDNNPEAALFFSELEPTCRKRYMGWVGEANRHETRLKRAREACELLAKGMKLPLK
jgi:uncharacterized protein YdeI (YjbR/CyaY-like superfamily)